MVHDNLTDAAERLAALQEADSRNRTLALRAILELAEQCGSTCQISTESLAGFLALALGEDA